MSKETKEASGAPREWKLRPLAANFCPEGALIVGGPPINDPEWVIEKSAFVALQEECDRLKLLQAEQLKRAQGVAEEMQINLVDPLLAERDALQAECEVHKESRKNLEGWNDDLCDENIRLQNVEKELTASQARVSELEEWSNNNVRQNAGRLASVRKEISALKQENERLNTLISASPLLTACQRMNVENADLKQRAEKLVVALHTLTSASRSGFGIEEFGIALRDAEAALRGFNQPSEGKE